MLLDPSDFFRQMLEHIKDPTSAKYVFPQACVDLVKSRGCKLHDNELYEVKDVQRLEKNSTVDTIGSWPDLSQLLEERATVEDRNFTKQYEAEFLAEEFGDKVMDAQDPSRAKELMEEFVKTGLQRRMTMQDADVDCATAAYLLYIGLLVSSMMLIIFGFVTHFVAKGMKRKSPRTQLRIFGMLAGLSILGMW